MDFEPYFNVHNLVSVHPKSVILGQMTNLKMVFHMVVSVYRLVKILKLAPVPWWISERLIGRRVLNRTIVASKMIDANLYFEMGLWSCRSWCCTFLFGLANTLAARPANPFGKRLEKKSVNLNVTIPLLNLLLIICIQLFWERLSCNRGTAYATMSKLNYYG